MFVFVGVPGISLVHLHCFLWWLQLLVFIWITALIVAWWAILDLGVIFNWQVILAWWAILNLGIIFDWGVIPRWAIITAQLLWIDILRLQWHAWLSQGPLHQLQCILIVEEPLGFHRDLDTCQLVYPPSSSFASSSVSAPYLQSGIHPAVHAASGWNARLVH